MEPFFYVKNLYILNSKRGEQVIFEQESGVTAAMLRGREGPLVPAQHLEGLVRESGRERESERKRMREPNRESERVCV